MSIYSCEYKFDLTEENEHYIENENLSILNLKDEPIEIVAKGILVTYKNKYYILTCEHCLFTNNLKYLKLDISNNQIIEVDIKLYLPEIDICLIELKDLNKINKGVLFYTFEYMLNDIDNLELFFIKDNEKIFVKNYFYEYDFLFSLLFPEIKILNIFIDEEIDIDNLKGLSGSPIYNSNNDLLGIISRVTPESKVIKCLCLKFVSFILKAMIDNGKERLDFIIIKTKFLIRKQNFYLKLLSNTNNYKSTINSEIKLKKKSYIYEINNSKINEDGLFFHYILEDYIPINTFILLLLCCNLKIDINYNLFYKKSIKEKKISFSEGKTYDSSYKLNFKDNNKRLIWKNFVFMELSENILSEYVNSNEIEITLENYNIFYDISTNNNKIILICEILESDIDKNLEELLLNKVDKVGRRKINNLDKLFNVLKNYKRDDVQFVFKNLNNFRTKKLLI